MSVHMKDDFIELPDHKTMPTMVCFEGILEYKSTIGARLTKFTAYVWKLKRTPRIIFKSAFFASRFHDVFQRKHISIMLR